MTHDQPTDEKWLKHKWSNNVCVRCGCERSQILRMTSYFRSGIYFDEAPECIDWEKENAKTID